MISIKYFFSIIQEEGEHNKISDSASSAEIQLTKKDM